MLKSFAIVLVLVTAGCAGGPAPAPAPAVAPAVSSIEVTAAMGSPHPGDKAPDFTLKDATGAEVHLAELEGNVVVLSFVASWCPFSKAEQPHLAKLPAAYAGKSVKFVVVDVQEDDAGFQKYLVRVAMPMPVVRDVDGKVAESFVAPGAQPKVNKRSEVPIGGNVVIDAGGVIRAIHLGDLAHYDAEMTITRKTIDEILAGAP